MDDGQRRRRLFGTNRGGSEQLPKISDCVCNPGFTDDVQRGATGAGVHCAPPKLIVDHCTVCLQSGYSHALCTSIGVCHCAYKTQCMVCVGASVPVSDCERFGIDCTRARSPASYLQSRLHCVDSR